LGVLIVVYIILRIIINSSYGQCLKCIKDNELKLEGLGYNTRRLKYIAVTISGLLSGVAGYLHLLSNRSIFPELGLVFYSAKVIFVALMGGIGSIIGPLLGCFIWFFIEEFLVTPGFLEITLGIAFLIVILRLPTGIIGLFKRYMR
jgi:branched-chain amino acid transport system permease protein